MSKGLMYISITIFGAIGSYIPMLFGASGLSAISIIGGVVGGIAGIWVAVKANDYI